MDIQYLECTPSIRMGKKGDLSDLKLGVVVVSKYLRNCWCTGIFPTNHLRFIACHHRACVAFQR